MHDLQARLRRYLLGTWRWRWLVVGIAWLLCLGGWFGVFLVPNQYEASARLYVDSDAALTPLLHGLALDNSPGNQLDMLQRTLLSRPNPERLISRTDLELRVRGPSDLERMVAGLALAIKVTPQTRNWFTISYRNTHPRLAYDVVQTVLMLFIESKAGSNRSDMANAGQFLEQQLANHEQKPRQMEAQRAAFTAKYPDLLPDANGGASRLDNARAAVRNLEESLKQVRLREALSRQQLAGTPPIITADAESLASLGIAMPDPAAAGPHACQELEAARVRYTDQHPTVVALRAECDGARKQGTGTHAAGRPGHTIANPVAEKLRLQIFDLEAAAASLTQQIAGKTAERDRLEAIARSAPGIQARYTGLNRDYDVLGKNYQEMIERREAMRLAAAADTDAGKVKLQVIDPPQVPQIPVVLPLGLAGGIAVSRALQQLDTSFPTLDELRGLGLPVVGSVSLVAARTPLMRRLVTAASFGVALLLLCAVYGGLLVRLRYRSAGA